MKKLEVYDWMMDDLVKIAKKEGLQSPSDAVEFLIDMYEDK